MMNRLSFLAAAAALTLACAGEVPPAPGYLSADHTSAARFSQLTDGQIAAVKGLRVYFQHASVGGNIYQGLLDLGQADPRFALTTLQDQPSALAPWLAQKPAGGWADYALGNPPWPEKLATFTAALAGGLGSSAQVAMMKFCFLDSAAGFDQYKAVLLAAEAAHPGLTLIWWTMPLTAGGSFQREAFNRQVREYTRAHGKILFDVADIESWTADGRRLTDFKGQCLDPALTADGAHLNDAQGLAQRQLAQALWVLLADVAQARTGQSPR